MRKELKKAVAMALALIMSCAQIGEVHAESNAKENHNSEDVSFEKFADNLAERLSNAEEADYAKIIADAYGNEKIAEKAMKLNSVGEELACCTYNNVTVVSEADLVDNKERVYDVDDNNSFIITPTHVIHEKLDVSEEITTANAKTKEKFSKLSKSAYGPIGNLLFTVTVECRFNYNGKKAWYKSDFDYYYTRGDFSIWQVSNWRGVREASGTSYKARCSGEFHYGLEYDGNGLILGECHCRNTITCDKDGHISKVTNW